MAAVGKTAVQEAAEQIRDELVVLSHDIHDHPEYGFQEYHACSVMTELLEKHGFAVSKGSAGIETAFVAVKAFGQTEENRKSLNIAFLAEYDALEGLGHGCGHNMVGTMAAGAGIALAQAVEQLMSVQEQPEQVQSAEGHLTAMQTGDCLPPVNVYVIGTPAEETTGGKIIMLENGVFDGIDYVLMCHPTAGPSMVERSARGCTTVYADFEGRAAHSSAPEKGVNALTAVRAAFNNIDVMRPNFRFQDNVNGIIREGGTANNIVPGKASCEFCLRSVTLENLENLVELVKRCIDSAAMLTQTKVQTKVDLLFSERYPNIPMGEAFKKNLESLGEYVAYPDPAGSYGSSDVSNLSLHIPTIHEYISIAPEEVNEHSVEFLEAAASDRSDVALLLGAKALAMTGFDILADEAFRHQIREAFEAQVPKKYWAEPQD